MQIMCRNGIISTKKETIYMADQETIPTGGGMSGTVWEGAIG
jgi:hypothetical protein